MQTLVYILAFIGGATILEVIVLIFVIIFSGGKSAEDEGQKVICCLTMKECIYDDIMETCIGCPMAEEAEKIGDR